MENTTGKRKDLIKLNVKELKSIAKSKGIRGYYKLRKAELIDLLRPSDQRKWDSILDEKVESPSPHEKEQAPRSPTRKDLMKMCKNLNIKYSNYMSKQEMIDVLTWNNEDSNINVHPDVQKRVTERQNKYRDNPERREKARECARRWRINNPEKAREYWLRWQESLFSDID